MVITNKFDPVRDKDDTFQELVAECRHAVPGARLSYTLRNRLEKYPLFVRKEIVNRMKVGCAPLFIACKRGQAEIAEYLITVCHADIEQRGLYEVPDDRSVHCVTPIWCAAVSGKLPIVQLLVRRGADINAVSDTGSTPVRSACFMTHLEVVEFLVKNGADINKPNFNGGTCLINSVQSAQLCEFLLEHGADVNVKDIQNKTALHYAIHEHRLETTKLLLSYNADYSVKSKNGDDALQMACLKGAVEIFEYLTDKIVYPPEVLANAHELMGATFLDEHNDIFVALRHWRIAIDMRERFGLLPKMPIMPSREGFRGQTEFSSAAELDVISADLDAIRIQSLLIAERILGPYHKDTVFRLMFRGASYADMMRYQRCIDLWRIALEIRVQKDSILFPDTCFSAQALVRLMINFNEKYRSTPETDANNQRFKDTIGTFKLLTNNIGEMRELLTIRPVHKQQMNSFDKILKCITHLIYLMLQTARSKEDHEIITDLVVKVLKENPRSASTEDTLLHLCVSKLNTIRSSYFMDEEPVVVFPKYSVIKFLLSCGAPVNARNDSKSTPLHVATVPYNYNSWLVKLLLDYGAHFDKPNAAGDRPSVKIMQNGYISDIYVLDYISLKCFCAATIIKNKIEYAGHIPKVLESFVKLHEP